MFIVSAILLIYYTALAEAPYFLDHYDNEHAAEITMVFSSHTEVSQDKELKRLKRILSSELSEKQKSQLKKQISRKLRIEKKALDLELFLVTQIENEHREKAFEAVLGEFSFEKIGRYQLRIDIASFVKSRLKEVLDLPPSHIDNFILLLTGEDVFPLLKGNFLENTPFIPSEEQWLLNEVGDGIRTCKGMMGTLALGRSDEAKAASVLLKPYYLPRPEFYLLYLETRALLKKMLMESGTLRLRLGLRSAESVEQALVNCDYLFDQRRDESVVEALRVLPAGKFLLTRGIAHRWFVIESLRSSIFGSLQHY